MDKLKKVVESKYFKVAFYSVAIVTFVAIVFGAGVSVGLHKARYSYQWGANYERNFAGRPQHRQMGPGGLGDPEGPMGFFGGGGREMRNANGLAGTVVSIADNLIVIKDEQNKENTVSVSDKTIIKAGRDEIKIGDLKNDERVVVIGKPDDKGTVAAEFIRVFDNNTNNPNQN